MFEPATYTDRRARLMNALDGGLVLLLGNESSARNYEANPYPHRQDSSFLYFTGLHAAGADALLDVDAGTATLFANAPDMDTVVWMGDQPAPSDQARAAGMDGAAPRAELQNRLAEALRQGRRVHILPPYRDAHRRRLSALLGLAPDRVDDHVSDPLVHAVVDLRNTKSPAELAELETAVSITANMHLTAMKHAAPGVSEQTILGALSGLVRSKGGRFSFLPIVSVDGHILHNHQYDNTLADGDLLLVDTGAEAPSGYAGDMTRVTPVGGSFSERQRAIYTAVLDAQESAIDAMAPGVPFREVHLTAARVLTEHLVDIGLMTGDPEEAVAAGAHALFFSHGLGHMMGLDVHDMEALGEDVVGYASDQSRSEQFGLNFLRLARPLEPGFVATVEPGCYFIPALIDQWAAAKRHDAFINYDAVDDYRDFGGIRIEDDVAVTEDGVRILGPDVPKTPDEVEAVAGIAAG